jgi:hypothetical protein
VTRNVELTRAYPDTFGVRIVREPGRLRVTIVHSEHLLKGAYRFAHAAMLRLAAAIEELSGSGSWCVYVPGTECEVVVEWATASERECEDGCAIVRRAIEATAGVAVF